MFSILSKVKSLWRKPEEPLGEKIYKQVLLEERLYHMPPSEGLREVARLVRKGEHINAGIYLWVEMIQDSSNLPVALAACRLRAVM